MRRSQIVTWILYASCFSGFGWAIEDQWQSGVAQARLHFVESNHSATLVQMNNLERATATIYQNIRTLAQLPSVRGIDRHAKLLSDEARITFQQIYNNLASSVDVSEVYVVPIDFSPTKLDPITLRNEEPILMFDELIWVEKQRSGSGAGELNQTPRSVDTFKTDAEVESFEYEELVEQATWLKANFPRNNAIAGFVVPFIAGREVITRDNRTFGSTLLDKDRKGTIFTVPFYGPDGAIKGMVAAVILTNALRDLMPSEHLALVNPANKFVSMTKLVSGMASSQASVISAKPDRDLIYSEVMPLLVKDSRSPWFVWSGLPNSAFEQSAAKKSVDDMRYNGLKTLVLMSILVGILITLVQRIFAKSSALTESLANSKIIAEQNVLEAHANAEQLQILNDDVSRLNKSLAQKIQQLTEAQEDIVRKGKMAQLGSLVATVAHELRNPLGGVRTTAFMLKRKLKDSEINVQPQLDRIESGVRRCDQIITQLVDFSRSTALNISDIDLCAWLETLLQEEAAKLPETIAVKCLLDEDMVMVEIDPERLRRGVVNLLANAAEALVPTQTTVTNTTGIAQHITVELARTVRGVEIRITDNGPGIAPEVMEKIGEPLFTTKNFGTGLGIAAVQKIVELHHGGLEIKSEFGKGACFTIWLPRRQPVAKAA